MPVTEQELISQCEIVLVYIKDRIYGELEKIRGPATKPIHSTITTIPPASTSTKVSTNPVTAKPRPSEDIDNALLESKIGITGSTTTGLCVHVNEDVTPQTALKSSKLENIQPTLALMDAPNKPTTGVIIPENVAPNDDGPPDSFNKADAGHPKPSLPGIDVFLSKTCMIPLVKCDFDLIKRKVETQDEQNKKIELPKEESATDLPNPTNTVHSSDSTIVTELRTSSHKCTLIDYKKFLEEFADIPPFPPKKKEKLT